MAGRRRIGLCFLMAALAACSGKAEDSKTDTGDAPAEDIAPKPKRIGGDDRPHTLAEATEGPSRVALWAVEDEDTKVYILGTIHLMNADTNWSTAEINRAFDEADAVYLEADFFSQSAQRAMGVVVSQHAEYP
ncbi:MAG: TraB/GumN family protein, partial [Pseudomonadota bacterium]